MSGPPDGITVSARRQGVACVTTGNAIRAAPFNVTFEAADDDLYLQVWGLGTVLNQPGFAGLRLPPASQTPHGFARQANLWRFVHI